MVIIRAWREDQIGLEVADDTDDLAATIERRQQLAVMIVEHQRLDPQRLGRSTRLGTPDGGKLGAAQRLMAGIAVGDRDKTGPPTAPGEECSQPAGFRFAIVRMSAKDQEARSSV